MEHHSAVDSSKPAHPMTPGSNSQHTIYAFHSNFIAYLSWHCEKNRNKQKESGFGQYIKSKTQESYLIGQFNRRDATDWAFK